MKKLITLLLTFVMLFSLASCGKNKTDGEKSNGEKNSDQITIGFSQVGSESEFRTANTKDIQEAAEANGINLQFSDAQQKQENQIKAIRSFIASEVDVIAFCPIVDSGWDTVLQEAKDAEIPVVLVDRGVTADESLYVTRIGTDAIGEGADSFKWVDQYLSENDKKPRDGGDTYNVAILEGTVGSSIAGDRLKGFSDALANPESDLKYEIILSQTGEYTRAKGNEVMESFLKTDQDRIDVLFAANDDMALGAIQAIKAAGLKPSEDIIIISIDGSKGSFQAMVDGDQNAVVEHSPFMGETLMKVVKSIYAGEEIEPFYLVEGNTYDQSVAEEELPNRKY